MEAKLPIGDHRSIAYTASETHLTATFVSVRPLSHLAVTMMLGNLR